MTHDEFAAWLRARENVTGDNRAYWGGLVFDDEPEPSEAMRMMWQMTGAQSAFSAMATQFQAVDKPAPAVSGIKE